MARLYIVLQCILCLVHASQDSPTWTNGLPTQLSDGTWPDEKYRQYLISPFRNKTFFPLFSTLPLEDGKKYASITTAVIWIHGLGANANSYFTDGVSIAQKAGVGGQTVTIAPWFGETVVNSSFWNSAALQANLNSIYWNDDVSSSHWLDGGNCSGQVAGGPYASFDILDKLAALLQSGSPFPNIKVVTVAGFSAGCQMSSRWAFFSDVLLPVASGDFELQVVASDCSSYMYLDATRPVASCLAKKDTGTGHTCSTFEKPAWTRRRYYNKYKYGLYEATSDVSYSDTQLATLTKQFPTKNIRFIFGDEDVCSCTDPLYTNPALCFHSDLTCAPTYGSNSTCCDTYPDTETSNAVDNSSSAELQGSNRLQRGLNYISHLKNVYNLSDDGTFPMYGFFNGGHDSLAFGSSDQFKDWALKGKLRSTVLI